MFLGVVRFYTNMHAIIFTGLIQKAYITEALLCFSITYYTFLFIYTILTFLLLTIDKWFLAPDFSLCFASSCFSYMEISFPTATLNIASTYSFQCLAFFKS